VFRDLGDEMKRDLDSIILTRQELQIMKVIWARGSSSVREVCDCMSKAKPTAYTTVLTLMGILEAKGVLVHNRSGRAYIYRSLLTRQQATRNHVHDMVNRFFEGNPEKLVEWLGNEVKTPEQLMALPMLLGSRR
jgi:BlaI family transcriptional regulator, penicillinase repressor